MSNCWEPSCVLLLPIRERPKTSKTKNIIDYFILVFELISVYICELDFFQQRLKQHLFACRGLFSNVTVRIDFCVGPLVVQNSQQCFFDLALYSTSQLCRTFAWIFCIEVLIDSFLSINRCLIRNSLTVAKPKEFSLYAGNDEKRNCYFFLLVLKLIQTHTSSAS